MKKNFGNYALLFINIFLLTIFSSCEKDEEFSNESLSIIKPSNKSSSTYRYKNASEIPEVFNVFTAKLKNAKSTFDQELHIDYHRIMEINTIQGGKTYSILMNKADNQDKSSFYNLVIKKDAQGNVNTPFIVKYTTNIAPHLITAEDYNNVQWNTQVMSVDAFMGVQSKSSDCIDPPTVPNTINNISFEYTGPMSPYFNNPSSTSGSGSSIPRTGILTICTTQIKTVSYHCNGPNSTEPHPPGPNGGEEGDNSCGDTSSGHSGTGTQQVIAINCIDVNIAVEPIPGTHDSAGNRIYNITSIILDGTTSICQAYEIYKHMLDNRDTLDAMGKSMVSAFEEETFIPTMGSTCNGTIRGSDSDITLNGASSGRSEQIQKSSTSDCPDLDNTGINIPTIVHNLINELNTLEVGYDGLTPAQKEWLEDPSNTKEAEDIAQFVEDNNATTDVKNLSNRIIETLRTDSNITLINLDGTINLENLMLTITEETVSVNQTEKTKENIRDIATILEISNPQEAKEIGELVKQALKDNATSPFDLWNILNKSKDIGAVLAKNKFKITGLSNEEVKAIGQDTTSISLLSTLREIANSLPKTIEEWEALASIMGPVLLDIATDLIPGVGELKAAFRSLEAINQGNYSEAAQEIALAVFGVIPLTKLGVGIVKITKGVVKSIKILKLVRTFLKSVGKTIDKGYKLVLDGLGKLKLSNKNGAIVAKGDEAVKTFVKKTADFTIQKFDEYVATISKRNPAGNVNDPRRIYQEKVAGLKEFEIKGGNNSKIWADGLERPTGTVLEAKHIGNPSASPYIPGSSAPPFIRDQIVGQFRDELRRYADVIADPNNPLTKLDIITNNQGAKDFFEGLLREFNIPGQVIIKP